MAVGLQYCGGLRKICHRIDVHKHCIVARHADRVGQQDPRPGIVKTWAWTFQRNETATATGRPAGSLMWAGLGNLFYWIDRKNGVGGFWGSQILPFQDAVSYPGFVDFEAAVYRHAL